MATYRRWSASNCCETHMVSHSVESWPLTKLNGGLSRLHCADEDAVSWLTNCGSWHAYENKKLLLNTNGIQPLRVTPKQPGIRAPILELWRILTYYYGLLFDIRQFHVASQMLSTQCDCHNLLITLIAGLCLQHLTAVGPTWGTFRHIAMACWSTFAKVIVKIQVTHFLAHIVDNYAVDKYNNPF